MNIVECPSSYRASEGERPPRGRNVMSSRQSCGRSATKASPRLGPDGALRTFTILRQLGIYDPSRDPLPSESVNDVNLGRASSR